MSADTEDPPVLEGDVLPRGQKPADTSYEVNLDPDVDPEDLPRGPAEPDGKPVKLPRAGKTRKPIIPVHLNSREKLAKRAYEIWSDVTYYIAFQGIRVIFVYPWLWSWWAICGGYQFFKRQRRWWWVSEATPTLDQAAIDNNGPEYRKHNNHVRSIRSWRGTVVAFEATGLIIAAVLALTLAPGWMQALLCLATWAGLAMFGRPQDRTMFTPAMLAPRIRAISGDIIINAYKSAGLCDPEKPGQELTFPRPMHRDELDKGTIAIVSCPLGTTHEQVVKARAKIASGLDVKLPQVYITEDDESERTHQLYIADRNPLAEPAGRTPLLNLKQTNIWRDAPMGLDQFGRKVATCLLWISIMIGSQPRKGKTFTVRHLALYAALDPYCKILLADGKSSADWIPLQQVAHRFIQGTRPTRDSNPVERLISMLDEVLDHIADVNDFLKTLGTDECPEGKITEELAHRYEICQPWLLIMEEYQEYVELDDQKTNQQIAQRLSTIRAIGPSAGVTVLSSTQKPSQIGSGDVQRLMTRYRDNHDVKYGLRCASRDVSNAILGSEAYSEGYDCSKLPLGKKFRGIGILYGERDEPPTVRGYLADGKDAEVICDAARRFRERAGTLSGDAAGDELHVAARDVLADVLDVFGDDDRLSWETLADRLAEQLPDRWHDVDGAAISAQLRNRFRVKACQVKRAGTNKWGCRQADVQAAQHDLARAA